MTAEPRVLSPEQITRRQRRAFRKAIGQRLWEKVESFTLLEYGVPSSDGHGLYIVNLADPDRGGRPSCNCAAGYHDVPCKHVCAVILSAIPPSWRGCLAGEDDGPRSQEKRPVRQRDAR